MVLDDEMGSRGRGCEAVFIVYVFEHCSHVFSLILFVFIRENKCFSESVARNERQTSRSCDLRTEIHDYDYNYV